MPTFKVNDRVQRKGWQLTALGTVVNVIVTDEFHRTIYIVNWDYRGIDNDLTTNFSDDLIPAHLVPDK